MFVGEVVVFFVLYYGGFGFCDVWFGVDWFVVLVLWYVGKVLVFVCVGGDDFFWFYCGVYWLVGC